MNEKNFIIIKILNVIFYHKSYLLLYYYYIQLLSLIP